MFTTASQTSHVALGVDLVLSWLEGSLVVATRNSHLVLLVSRFPHGASMMLHLHQGFLSFFIG
jgi:hypothetical protein